MKKLSFIDLLNLVFFTLALIFIPLAFSKAVYATYRLPKAILIWLTGMPLLLLFCLKSWQQKKLTWPGRWFFFLPGLLIIWLALGLFFSLQPLISLAGYRNSYLGFLTYLACFGFFLGGYNLAKELKEELPLYFLRLVSFVAFGASVWAWLQYLGLNYPTSFSEFGGQRVGSLIGNPNNFGGWLAFILPLLLAYYYFAPQAEKPWSVAALLFTLSGILLSQSASALGTALVAGAVTLVFMAKPQLTRQAKVLVLLAVFIIGIAFLLLTLPQEKASVSSRLMLWKAGLRITAAKPVFGMGLDALRYVTPRYADARGVPLTDEKMADIHNLFLDFSAQAGLVSAVLLSLFLFSLVLQGFIFSSKPNYFSLGLSGAVLSYVLMMQTTPGSPALLSYFWLTAGLAAYFFWPQVKEVSVKSVLSLAAIVVSLGLLALALFFSWRVWQADYYFNLAMKTTSANESISFTQKATAAFPYDYYYGMLASTAIKMTEDVDRQFLPIVKLAAERGIAVNSLESNNYAAMGYYYTLLGGQKSYQQAIFYFKKALKRDPYNFNAYYGLAKSYFLSGQKKLGQKWRQKLSQYLSPADERILELKNLEKRT